ncbi:M20 family metallo-hydrolase [Carboxylicivirga sp. N1Y90]|uniref:M20 family metallo-hydrolase n=1 Tax=Carboxylicivirga fragile TaxID=3417571 RepID=UPI003D3421AC|nr:M20 family metallo-hydrolase [Marinilabiliaceae bacterium N1Y90]
MLNIEQYTDEAIELLKQLITTESFSRNEDKVLELMSRYLSSKGLNVNRSNNNIWCWAKKPNPELPSILLNSHLDTVKPSSKWTYDPFAATLEGDKLTGLGSNDAGGPLVALMATFLCLKDTEQDYNLVFAATAEEEISGVNGVASILDQLGKIDLGIVGEPTQMEMAVAEKGLLVLDCEAHGKTGHAARDEGENALYKAMSDIAWFQTYEFPKVSPHLGKVKMTVTQISAGNQHNVVPDSCKFVVDVRLNECYSNKELHQLIAKEVDCDVKARSYRINSSSIPIDHPLVERGIELGRNHYGSPTTSDQAVMDFTTLKMGPGDSARSHTPDEYIYLNEIREGVAIYVKMLDKLEIK